MSDITECAHCGMSEAFVRACPSCSAANMPACLWTVLNQETPTPSEPELDDLGHYMESASAYTSLRVELARIFGAVQPREGETWNAAMLRRITEHLIKAESAEKLLKEIRDGKHSIPGTLVQIDRLLNA